MSQIVRRTTVIDEYSAPEPEETSSSAGGGSFNIFKLLQWLLFTGEGLFFCAGIGFAVFVISDDLSRTNPAPPSPPVNNIIINNN
jgi:hypothetical protein